MQKTIYAVVMICMLTLVGTASPTVEQAPKSFTSEHVPDIPNLLAPVTPGIELQTLPTVTPAIQRYPAWPFNRATATTTPVGFVDDARQTRAQIRAQNELLAEKFGTWVDFVSFNLEMDDGAYLDRVYFPEGAHPIALTWEYINTPKHSPYVLTESSDGFSTVDLSNPWNELQFYTDMERLDVAVMTPYTNRYLTIKGRRVLYIWAPPFWVTSRTPSDIERVFRTAAERYNLYFIFGIPGDPSTPEGQARIAACDALMFYNIYDPNAGGYFPSVWQYHNVSQDLARRLRQDPDFRGKRQFATFIPGYNDTKVRDGNPPAIPTSIFDLQAALDLIFRGMQDDIYDPALLGVTSWDEIYEGTVIIPTVPNGHIAPFLAGTTALDLLARTAPEMRRRLQ